MVYEPKREIKPIKKNRIVENFMIIENSDSYDCFDLSHTSSNFYSKVHGIKIVFHNPETKYSLIVNCIIDDIPYEMLNYPVLKQKVETLINQSNSIQQTVVNTPNSSYSGNSDEMEVFKNFVNTLRIKDLLIYNDTELIDKYHGIMNQRSLIQHKSISQIVNEFINGELYAQRTMLIMLLIHSNNPEYRYLAYLIYDLLSNDNNGNVDTQEQNLIYDSLPWSIKCLFKDAMKTTIRYTTSLANMEEAKIPIEQQICLMKAPDSVKEKAMVKLKEVKAKSEDGGSKARQYLEGMMKIPFGVFREEPILKVMPGVCRSFVRVMKDCYEVYGNIIEAKIPLKNSYTSVEVAKYYPLMVSLLEGDVIEENINSLTNKIVKGRRKSVVENLSSINKFIKDENIKHKKVVHSGKKMSVIKRMFKHS